MRIISGNFKGFSLETTKNKITRPLKDIARESIFYLLSHSNKILFELKKTNILDLYAGTGSFGLECLSRQANSVSFIENEKNAIKILKKNIEKLKLEKKSKIFTNDVFKFIKSQKVLKLKFDLIFCDPPFRDLNMFKLIELISNKNILNKDGIIVLHRNKATKEKLPNYLKIIDERIYGLSKIIFSKILS